MKRKKPYLLAGLVLLLFLLCTACGNAEGQIAPQDDPNEGLGGGFNEDIVIDGKGNWSLYQRAPGAESAEMDCGTFSYSTDEASTYYADSTMYNGVSYKVFELDEDVLVWDDEGSYYLME